MHVYRNDFALYVQIKGKWLPYDISSFRPNLMVLEKGKKYNASASFEKINIGIQKPCLHQVLRSVDVNTVGIFYRIR